jgi:hypothetical protein
MSSRASRTLVATAPDGTEVTQKTSGSYDTAGLLQAADGHWLIAAHGWSRQSVYDRTHARYNRGDYRAMHVSDLVEQTAPVIREYFGTHTVGVRSVYSTGTHEGLTETELREVLHVAGATMADVDAAARVAREHPGATADVHAAGAIAVITYDGGSFSVRIPAKWYNARSHAGRSQLRYLARHGWTGIAFSYLGRVADFTTEELVKSMSARKASA